MEDRYHIRGKIGEGALGMVYRAYDTRRRREVAIKRIRNFGLSPGEQAAARQRFLVTYARLAKASHPHIADIIEVDGDCDGTYVVMDLVKGLPLEARLEQGTMDWTDFRQLVEQCHDALAVAHDCGLMHGDLKPSNLMLVGHGQPRLQVKMLDFGLAGLAMAAVGDNLGTMEAAFSSLLCMAPERFELCPAGPRSDLYSLGCIFYQVLGGGHPFPGRTGNEVMEAHLCHSVRPLVEIRGDLPRWLSDWVMWLVNRFPGDRPTSARESLEVFHANLRDAGLPGEDVAFSGLRSAKV